MTFAGIVTRQFYKLQLPILRTELKKTTFWVNCVHIGKKITLLYLILVFSEELYAKLKSIRKFTKRFSLPKIY